jgi:leader peptidase (prepilin peptidase) / N-methyltransferase
MPSRIARYDRNYVRLEFMNIEIVIFAFLGLVLGAFINRLTDNLPRYRSAADAPLCPFCLTPRRFVDQFAVFSHLLLRGRCHNCRAPIPFRTPFVELANAALLGFLWSRDGTTVQFALHLIYSEVFLIVLVTDLEHRLIYNAVMFPAIILAAIASPWSQHRLNLSLLGGACAFTVVFLIYISAIIFARARRLDIVGGAFGQGDVTLATFMGVVTGFPNALTAIVIAILLGGAGAIAFLAYEFVAHHRIALSAAIPYGPFFCIAGWVMMIFS